MFIYIGIECVCIVRHYLTSTECTALLDTESMALFDMYRV